MKAIAIAERFLKLANYDKLDDVVYKWRLQKRSLGIGTNNNRCTNIYFRRNTKLSYI